jgi:hypothetical protein
MSAPATASHVHSVQFYDESKTLIDRLCGMVGTALPLGSAVLMVITLKHRVQLVKTLGDEEIDVRHAARAGRFVMCDAAETLELFMVDGLPDRARFDASVGRLIFGTKAAAPANTLTVFGEMVAVLWEAGNQKGALALEELWNDVLQKHGFHLHCAYPRWAFVQDPDHLHMIDICRTHSHVL